MPFASAIGMREVIDHPCALWNSGPRRGLLRWIMTFAQRKFVVLAAWVATVATVGMILAIDRPSMWMLVACFSLISAAIGNWFWDAPQATLSQLIARGRSQS